MRTEKVKIAYFAAGCFWGVEQLFIETPGVVKTRAGYMGGDDKLYSNPTYEQVCSHRTGHAEAVEVKFDPKKTTYWKLLEVFFSIHDPTQLNRQGYDVGDNYRSAIFYVDESQKKTAEAVREKLQEKLGKKRLVVTEMTKAKTFWPAEEYHQKYYQKTGQSCHVPGF